MRFALLVTLALMTIVLRPLYGLSNAQKLVHTRTQSFDNALLDATGVVRMMDEYNLQKKGASIGYKGKIDTATCSAIFVEKPAWFITSAYCFSDATGRVDGNRKHARVFVEGRAWEIDPRSITIHKGYQRGVPTNDLAIFSVMSNEASTFFRYHDPIPLVPEDSWLVPGQPVRFVTFGGTNNAGEHFGTARTKRFAHHLPDPEDVNKAGTNLFVSPTEQVITYESLEGKGVNCLGDSGGGAFVELNQVGSDSSKLYLQSLIVGKVGPDGNDEASCEDIDRYVVNVDLRYEHQWLEEAIAMAKSNIAEEQQKKSDYFSDQKKIYGKTLYGTWSPLPLNELETFQDSLSHLMQHEQHPKIHKYMFEAEKRFKGYTTLEATHTASLLESFTQISLPNNPFAPLYDDWILAERRPNKNNTAIYRNPEKETLTGNFRAINAGTTPITIDKVTATGSDNLTWSGKDGGPYEIAPGDDFDFWVERGKIHKIEELTFHNYKGHSNMLIYVVPSRYWDRTLKTGWNNTYNLWMPRTYRIYNPAPTADVWHLKIQNVGPRPVNFGNLTVYHAYSDTGDIWKWRIWEEYFGLGRGYSSSSYERGGWWNLHSVRFCALGEGTTTIKMYVDSK